MIVDPILDLRFVIRDGKRILQAARNASVVDGDVVLDWNDVPLEEED